MLDALAVGHPNDVHVPTGEAPAGRRQPRESPVWTALWVRRSTTLWSYPITLRISQRWSLKASFSRYMTIVIRVG